MDKPSKNFIRDHIIRQLYRVITDSQTAIKLADEILDDVVADIEETADPENWHDGDINIAFARVLEKRLCR